MAGALRAAWAGAKLSDVATVADVCTDLWEFLNSIGTAHYFSMLGLIDEKERIARMLAISVSEGNDDP